MTIRPADLAQTKAARAFEKARERLAQERGRPGADPAWVAKLDWQTTATGFRLKPTVENIKRILVNDRDWAHVIAFDSFRSQIVATSTPPWDALNAPGEVPERYPAPWSDVDMARLRGWLHSSSYEIQVSTQAIGEAVVVVAERTRIHPVRDYLRSIAWDGTRRLESWLARYVGATDTAYTRAVGRCFLIAAVARAIQPGCKVDTIVCLEGAQGRGKSRLIRALFGVDDAWVSDTPLDLSSKDRFTALRGRWAVEWAELDGLSRAESERIKAFVSSSVDTYRPPYGKSDVSIPRSCVFIGTTNSDTYLQDATGNRRWWPVRVGTIDLQAIERDRAQLWAEAVVAYDQGERWHLDAAHEQLAATEQADRVAVDPWHWVIDEHACRRDSVTTSEILSLLDIPVGRRTRHDEQRVGACLRLLGFTRKRGPNKPGQPRSYYYQRTRPSDPTDLSATEVESPPKAQDSRDGPNGPNGPNQSLTPYIESPTPRPIYRGPVSPDGSVRSIEEIRL